MPDTIKPSLLLIAASTGGPGALRRVFAGFSVCPDVPVLVVQHMPAGFTQGLADKLDALSPVAAAEARAGEALMPGRAYVAPGGSHMLLSAARRIVLNQDPSVNGVRPSADVLFESVSRRFAGEAVAAVILTGMGRDGTAGVRALKARCRCVCITQDEASCAVFGMPKAVAEAGLSDRSVPLAHIAGTVTSLLRRGG